MVAAMLIRRALVLGSALVTTGALCMAGVAQPAAATATVLQATVDCLNVNYSGDTRDWYPSNPRVFTSPPSTATPVPGGSLNAVPATHAFQFAQALPGGATSVGIAAQCSSGHSPYGDYGSASGITGIPSGTTTVTASWACSTGPVYPGPWLTTCSLQSVSYS
jgi:hypothetical protein